MAVALGKQGWSLRQSAGNATATRPAAVRRVPAIVASASPMKATPQRQASLMNSAARAPRSQGFGESLSFDGQCRPEVSAASAAAADAGAFFDADPQGNSFIASIRAVLFYVTTLVLAVPLFIFMVLVFPFVYLTDKYRRTLEHKMNNIWAKMSTSLFYRVEIEGKENLPSNDTPAMYVTNHSSYLDIYTLFHLDRNFKFISKLSNFLIPLIGWSMFLTGHVPLVRTSRKSQFEALKVCRDLTDKGCSLLFFPEGTRTDDGKMHEFKKGAFSVAAKQKIPVVPITLVGTYQLMKNGDEGKLYPGTIRIVVHPQIDGNTDADTMMAESYKRIASALPPGAVA